ncbi:transcription factor-like protein DPB [Silene latifolia]|uniref:transcription factor-like protein DPB n=1 Tax=Silene latifolia TaxID=37657 RepID=UPI003D776FA1
MVTGNSQEDEDRKPKGVTRSWGTAVSGQSVSTSGSGGSPSSRSEAGMATPARDNTILRLGHLEIQAEDSASQGAVASKKKKRGQRATGTDKSGRGLRQFSMKVCEKVESKGRTTYNEVADELVAEYADASNALGNNEQGYDEKNIRRRVYDALNVLMAMDIISKDKKEIQWKGLPRTSINDIEELKTERAGLKNRIEKKAAYLRELEEQFVGYQNLIQRNQEMYGNGNTPTGGVALPFILVQTRPNATVEVEISEDMQLVHFDFNSTPFELHDDNYVLKQMKFCERRQLDNGTSDPPTSVGENPSMSNGYRPQPASPISNHHAQVSSHPSSPPRPYHPQLSPSPTPLNSHPPACLLPSSQPSTSTRTPTSPPLPGILKARVQNER